MNRGVCEPPRHWTACERVKYPTSSIGFAVSSEIRTGLLRSEEKIAESDVCVYQKKNKGRQMDDVHAVLEEEACEKRAYSCFGTTTVTALAGARKRAEERDRKGLQSKAVVFSKNVLSYSEV